MFPLSDKRSLATMGSWTPEHNTYLSCLLDDVTGTEEMVKIRNDYCKIHDCISSCNLYGTNRYYTGSKAEGLYLPGSDNDYMLDIDDLMDIAVSDSILDLFQSTRKNKFLVVTDNVPPAFCLLRCISRQRSENIIKDLLLDRSIIYMDDYAYLSSHMYMTYSKQIYEKLRTNDNDTLKIQGPSVENWTEYHDLSESGNDHVSSIHLKYWPSSAAEWRDRPRRYGWPSQHIKESIETFGFHLVAVGHPLSTKKLLEWRLSFSIAERTLVWSFNHTQLQCYAVMKLILKEFIKKQCSEKHKGVLCSYFIKTFLFWHFERTESSFWQPTNLTACIMYLLNAFYDCIQMGVLRHYFVPRFNLFEIKLTPDAQSELLHLFRMVLEIGIPILEQCDSLSVIYMKFREVTDVNQCKVREEEILRYQVLNNDKTIMESFTLCVLENIHWSSTFLLIPIENILAAVVRLINDGDVSTSLPAVTIRNLCRRIAIERLYECLHQGTKCTYYYMKALNKNVYATDKATSKLWFATFLLQQKDYGRSLKTINDMLSSIPPYALYYSVGVIKSSDDCKRLYVDRFAIRDSDTICRANEAWLVDFHIFFTEYSFVPRAIQIELDFCDPHMGVRLSPFTYAYYLMFLCYHGLGLYENRDCALRQLADIITDEDEGRLCKFFHHTGNIVGHCLLIAGYVDTARSFFMVSAECTKLDNPVFDKYNAAYKYLSLM